MLGEPWRTLLLGYVLTVAIEAPIIFVALSHRHSWRLRLFAGVWLTACTYPVVILVIPPLLAAAHATSLYYPIAEAFAAGAEILLFWLLTARPPLPRSVGLRDAAAIIVANLASFLFGLALWPP